MIETRDLEFLNLCVSLAREALETGDAPFGSVLVSAEGVVLKQDRNRTKSGEAGDFKPDATLHPEFVLARWAQLNLTPEQRATSTLYTSGEHCPMCAAAHAYVGLGRIVYAASASQYASWMREMSVNAKAIVAALPINAVAPSILAEGPVHSLTEQLKELHRQRWSKESTAG